MEKTNVTMQEVADKVGVSKSTVSRVISNSPEISEKTKQKVLEAMEELNYHPSAIARSLANRKSKNIGLVLPSDDDFFSNPFFQESLRSIAKTASLRGYDTLLVYNGRNETDSIKRVVNAKKVDGIILMRSSLEDKAVEYLRNTNFPFVLIGTSLEHGDVFTVDTDNSSSAMKLTEILIEKGCRKIAFIGGDVNSVVTVTRYKGYRSALEKHSIEFDESLVREDRFNEKYGYSSMQNILELHPDVDGVIVTDALIFLGVSDYLIKNRPASEKRIYIGGFSVKTYRNSDNITVINADVNSKRLGELSCNKIVDILEKKPVERHSIVDYIIHE